MGQWWGLAELCTVLLNPCNRHVEYMYVHVQRSYQPLFILGQHTLCRAKAKSAHTVCAATQTKLFYLLGGDSV